jgi:hypothetical protein
MTERDPQGFHLSLEAGTPVYVFLGNTIYDFQTFSSLVKLAKEVESFIQV